MRRGGWMLVIGSIEDLRLGCWEVEHVCFCGGMGDNWGLNWKDETEGEIPRGISRESRWRETRGMG